VGDCLADEHHNPANGDGLQETTGGNAKGGLLVWRKADDFTAFTDGYRSLINSPSGVARLNTVRFAWEANPNGLPVVSTPGAAPRARDDVVVFLQGYGSAYPVPDSYNVFRYVKSDLVQRGWTADRFLAFGYAGGSLQDGAWTPHPYTCVDTTRNSIRSPGIGNARSCSSFGNPNMAPLGACASTSPSL
jgi:hypothetical protein